MSLNAKIARLQLGSLPDVVVKRLLRRQDIATLAEMGSAQVGVLGEFHFADIRAALSKGEFGTAIDVPRRRGGDTITMVRFETGLHSARISNGPEVVLPEFALLDSNASVRLSALSELEKRSKPCWSNCDHWRTLISERSLTDSEFGQVIEELQNVPERVLAGIAATVERGSFGVKDLIPVDRTYYESLVGRIPGAQTVDDYAALELSPHLARVLNTNSTWGIRCIQAANVSSLIDLVETSKSSTNESLIAALQASGLGKTSLGYLSTYLICQSRISGEGRFSEFAADALNRLTTQAARDDTSDGIEDLLLAFMRLTLNTISETELFWLGPPYWRRVAAFAHAYFLLDTIDFSTWNKAELISWCDAQQTINGTVIGILDFVREPAWRADSQTASGLSLAALMRAINWSADAEVNFAGLSLTQTATIQALTPKFRLAFGLSDPLCGGQRRQGTATAPTIDEDLLQGFKNEGLATDSLNRHQTWYALAYSSRIFAFSPGLLVRVRGIASNIQLNGSELSDEQYSSISYVAELAAIQSDVGLAEILANSILRSAEHLNKPADVAKLTTILVMASGAVANWSDSLTWAADRLVALAYRLPRGPCSEELAAWIEVMQRFIPLRERRWGKAWMIARSASL